MVAIMWHEIKRVNSFGIFVLTYKCFVCMIDVFIISSPYLLVFGDDRDAVHMSRNVTGGSGEA